MIKTQVSGVNALKSEIEKQMKKLTGGNKHALIGYPDNGATEEDGTLISMVAAANHFGTDTIPARPFLDVGVEKAIPEINKEIEEGIEDIIEGKSDMDKVLNRIGLIAVGYVQQEITDIRTPPNSPETIKRKKSSNPLIDTGNMRQSTTYILTKNKPQEGI